MVSSLMWPLSGLIIGPDDGTKRGIVGSGGPVGTGRIVGDPTNPINPLITLPGAETVSPEGPGESIWPSAEWLMPETPDPTKPAWAQGVDNWLTSIGTGLSNTLGGISLPRAQEDPETKSWLRNTMIGAGNVAWDALGNMFPNPLESGAAALDAWKDLAWTPEAEAAKKAATASGTDVPKEPAVAPLDIYGTQAAGGPGGTGATGAPSGAGAQGIEIELGKKYIPPPPPTLEAPTFPNMPAIPAPAPRPQATVVDWAPYLERMKQYEPKDLDRGQYMRQRLLGNLSRALAAGASGSGWSGSAGALARFGAGFGEATAGTGEEWQKAQMGIDEQQRQFGLDSLQMEMDLKQKAQQVIDANAQVAWQSGEDVRQTDIQNTANEYNVLSKNIAAIHETNQANAERMYEYETTKGQLTEDKVLPGTGKGTIAIQHTDPDGKTSIKVYKFGDSTSGYDEDTLDKMKKLKDLGMEDSPQYKAVRYGPLFQAGDTIGIQREIAREAIRGQYLEQLVGEDVVAELNEEVQEDLKERGIMPGSDEYTEELEGAMAQMAAMRFNLAGMTPEQVQGLAGLGNYGMQLILGNITKKQGAQ